MSDRLPPLTALRAFDAAARHLSFARAAAELNVTPAALSFQIKSLEAHLGHPLFHRLNRAVELTESGKALAPGCAEGFDALASAWRQTRKLHEDHILQITAGPGFTAKWLAPRIYDFARHNPEIDLRFAASLRLNDLERDGLDIAIRFGQSRDPAYFSEPLIEEWISPVMTPEMAQRFPTPDSLCDAPLLLDDSLSVLDPPFGWPNWLQAAGLRFTPSYNASFSQSDHALDAALAGAGVAMGRSALIARDLRAGRLVAPYELGLPTGGGFRLLCRIGMENRPHIAAFRTWVRQEMAAMMDELAQLFPRPAPE